MSSVSRFLAILMIAGACAQQAPAQAATPALPHTLRVCADPNNLPYSNEQKQGFENQIADLIAKDFNMNVEYLWFRQGEKFFKRTLNSCLCDIVMGVPTGFDEAATTKPYYRSTYVFITRRSDHLDITSLDDPRLRTVRIGVHILGDANDSTPPVHALIRRGIVKNLVGYSIFGNLNEKNPPADVIHALEDGKVDVAIVWGPLGGYFSRNASVPLSITPIEADSKHPDIPFQFDIGIGVRERDAGWRDLLDHELDRRQADIDRILKNYGIPPAERPVQAARAGGEVGRTQ
ncbi:MAG TPA: substrate-binding domain-containing protein [Terracidiphilus sp.]